MLGSRGLCVDVRPAYCLSVTTLEQSWPPGSVRHSPC